MRGAIYNVYRSGRALVHTNVLTFLDEAVVDVYIYISYTNAYAYVCMYVCMYMYTYVF